MGRAKRTPEKTKLRGRGTYGVELQMNLGAREKDIKNIQIRSRDDYT